MLGILSRWDHRLTIFIYCLGMLYALHDYGASLLK